MHLFYMIEMVLSATPDKRPVLARRAIENKKALGREATK
jgi:hypothetical protein